MWRLEINRDRELICRLRLPAEGLRCGPSADCDVQLPDLEKQWIKIEPARREIWITLPGQEPRVVPENESFTLGRYELHAVRVGANDRSDRSATGPTPTKILRYNPQSEKLTDSHFFLCMLSGPDIESEVELTGETAIIGSGAGCDLVLNDEYVSGRHARLRWTSAGWMVADLDSRNGIILDGLPVKEALWRPNAKLQLGKTTILLKCRNRSHAVPAINDNQYAGLVGQSAVMRRVFGLIEQVSGADATVLIQGPTGSGKELVARALHYCGRRAAGPFVPVNCGAIARDLVAGELFGHVRGAYTGATDNRPGMFEMADHGTIFLDEISELPLDLQPNLLRVLEEGEVRRIGGKAGISIDVRIVAATHRDLRSEVKNGRFREDLFFRLEMITITLPPLRERLEDLPLLVNHLLSREAERLGRPAPQVTTSAMEALRRHSWPGNVRELRNVLTRALVLAEDRRVLRTADLFPNPPSSMAPEGSRRRTIDEVNREALLTALRTTDSRSQAAESLGISISNLYYRMKKYNLKNSDLKME